MTPRYTKALLLAAKAHEGQARKGTALPYIVHPVGVAALVAKYGGDEDQQIAGLLHDVLEDAGEHLAVDIEQGFGDRVLRLVRACTDGVPDASGRKPGWEVRKRAYLEHLALCDDEALLVSGCDKLYNARAILEDLIEVGPAVFTRFSAGKYGTLWYYQALAQVFEDRGAPVAAPLRKTVQAIVSLSES